MTRCNSPVSTGKHLAGLGKFTLVELLVVIAIIGILVGLLPGGAGGSGRRRQASCGNNMMQLGLPCITMNSIPTRRPESWTVAPVRSFEPVGRHVNWTVSCCLSWKRWWL